MEDAILILRHIKVENANAVSGITWGFPAITNFMGFVHSISRTLSSELNLKLTGCGIVSHSHQIQSHQPKGWGDHVFALTRNPLNKNGTSPSFVEEGRMHMDISLIIPVVGDLYEAGDVTEICSRIRDIVLTKRLAGGSIWDVASIDLEEPPDDIKGMTIYIRKQMKQLIPGFVLVQRSQLLTEHSEEIRKKDPESDDLDAWMDFSALKFKAERKENNQTDDNEANWSYQMRPGKGWLVPIMMGYRAISDLYKAGEVARTRDTTTPFRFVEAVYSIGEWLSPHRLQNFEQMLWRYDAQPDSGWYLCKNNYNPQ
ncbi:CRISPR-associated protein, Csy2 family [Desulfamplus magnetovallimortis]|uniref:CRISPR-associated protein, Csy2 family n=1 Tax=Desulfamplus magnetovallimortis TaxID=1246637 RepID=A0A1W1HHP2_9BACT|nr:type I-F CRISPR-associated protein Csy2 [Desulfamplus magnetovallimortis]SLM32017.1 CRISPR-associated protein, Csy2 family [Desulfamplus magnetovallimortis]